MPERNRDDFGDLGCLAGVGWVVVAGVGYGVAVARHWDALTKGPKPGIIVVLGFPYAIMATLVWLVVANWRPRAPRASAELGTCDECGHAWSDHAGVRPRADIDGCCRRCVHDGRLGSAGSPICRETYLPQAAPTHTPE